MGPYHAQRYALYAKAVETAAATKTPVDKKAYNTALAALAHEFQYETHWTNTSTIEPADPVGDLVPLARQLWHKYSPANLSALTRRPGA